VERLMDVTDVVDDEAESERLLVVLVAEPFLDLADVGGGGGDILTLKEGSKISESIDDVD